MRKKGDYIEAGGALNSPFAALAGRAVATAPNAASTEARVAASDVAPTEAPRRAVIRVERKGRGGREATVVTHLGLSAAALTRWCAELRRELGCGGSVEGDTLVLQGDLRDRLEAALVRRGVARVQRG